jgi:hypothetical protein
MIKLDHTTLVQNPSMGWYEIGGKTYWDKASALLEGSRLGFKGSNLKWNFNDAEFGKFDWTIEPPGDIKDYYWARAKQLREKYDYIILNFSGGSDSATVLYSFIQQGLFVDEVIYRHATAGTSKYKANTQQLDATNEFSEYEFAGKPHLEWLAKVSPKTKITVHDFSLDVIDNDQLVWDENFIHWCGDFVSPGIITRYNHANMDHLRLFDKGKRVGIIFGVDKPRLIIENGKFYTFFVDRPVHIAQPALVNNGYTNTEVELFFWSPALPQLVIKQCHLIKKWFDLPFNARLKYMLNSQWLLSPHNRTAYEAVIKGVIYPDYDLSTFQCNKPIKTVFQEWDYWMEDFKGTTGYKTFMRGVMHLYKNIDPTFLRRSGVPTSVGSSVAPDNWEYKPCISNLYELGNAN